LASWRAPRLHAVFGKNNTKPKGLVLLLDLCFEKSFSAVKFNVSGQILLKNALQVSTVGPARYLHVLKELPKNALSALHAHKPPQAARTPLSLHSPRSCLSRPVPYKSLTDTFPGKKSFKILRDVYFFFSNYKNLYFSTQWSMFMIHSGPVGGKNKNGQAQWSDRAETAQTREI
jgi:hypothetical protein